MSRAPRPNADRRPAVCSGRRSAGHGRDGYILVAVLAVMLLLAGLVAGGSVMVRSALGSARAADGGLALDGLLKSGVEITGYQLGVLKLPAGVVSGRRINLTGGSVVPTVTDEGGKVDLNGADPALLRNLFEGAGMDEGGARDAVAALVALRGPVGNEDAHPGLSFSEAAMRPVEPPHKHRGLRSLNDLANVPGITAADMRALAGRVTVFNPDGRIDLLTAGEDVLSAVPSLSKAVVTDILARRDGISVSDVRSLWSSFGAAKRYMKTDAGPAYSVRVTATAADGRKKSVDLVMAPSKSPNAPFYILDWQD